ncbi:MAG TPA: FliM/FliN family flagellar motor C-terminal domain-containing protein [Dongiaceae bacterium]|nr:FliM/FliN family flagellar motor C-terminal domain-containing protein [Dongiaceae bacterium]
MSSSPTAAIQKRIEYSDEVWEQAGFLPCLLSVDVPLLRFTVRELLQLERGSIVESKIVNGGDVPVYTNKRLIAWAEFEVVGPRLAIRLTELI